MTPEGWDSRIEALMVSSLRTTIDPMAVVFVVIALVLVAGAVLASLWVDWREMKLGDLLDRREPWWEWWPHGRDAESPTVKRRRAFRARRRR